MSFRFYHTSTNKSVSLLLLRSSSSSWKLIQKAKTITTPKVLLDVQQSSSSCKTSSTTTLFVVVATIGGTSCLLFGNPNRDDCTSSGSSYGSITSLNTTTITLLDDGGATPDPTKNVIEHDRYSLNRWMNRWSKGDTRWHSPKVHPMLYKYTHLLLSDNNDDQNKEDSDSTTSTNGKNNHTNSRTKNILVPLCGKTVDMKYLASLPMSTTKNNQTQENAFHVIGIDGIELALEEFASDPNNTDLNLVKKGITVTKETEHDSKNTIQQTWWFGKSISLLVTNFFQVTKDDIVTAMKENVSRAENTTKTNQGMRSSTNLSPTKNTIAIDAVWDRGSLVAIDPSLRKEYVEVIGRLMSKSKANDDTKSGGGRYLLATIVRGNSNDKRGPPYTVSKSDVYELFENQSWVDSIELIETRSATSDNQSWYGTIMTWYRLGFFAKEVIYLIKTK